MLKTAEEYAKEYQIIGLDNGLFPIFQVVSSIARYNINVLITGETGTGKELLADFIHNLSSHKDGKIVKINCAALPDNLLESELFGYEKGAFTGACNSKQGKIELAEHGTLFLDEIGEIPPELQAKLLRVLQTKEVSRIGSLATKKIDFRLIAATNKNLEKAVQTKMFRYDLYYRLACFPIHIPPLRERIGDFPALIRYLTEKICSKTNLKDKPIESDGLEILKNYNWPGNIRELENIIFQALFYAQEQPEISCNIINKLLSKNKYASYQQAIKTIMHIMIKEKLNLKTINREIILTLLKHYRNNVNLIRKNTGISKDRIYRYKKNLYE